MSRTLKNWLTKLSSDFKFYFKQHIGRRADQMPRQVSPEHCAQQQRVHVSSKARLASLRSV